MRSRAHAPFSVKVFVLIVRLQLNLTHLRCPVSLCPRPPLTSCIVGLSTAALSLETVAGKKLRATLRSRSPFFWRKPGSVWANLTFPSRFEIESCESWDSWLILSTSPKKVDFCCAKVAQMETLYGAMKLLVL